MRMVSTSSYRAWRSSMPGRRPRPRDVPRRDPDRASPAGVQRGPEQDETAASGVQGGTHVTVTTARTNEAQRGLRVEHGAKRVRAYLGGELIADTTRPRLVWEVPYYPAYYLPRDDVRMELLTPTERTERSPSRGEARFFTVKGGDKQVEDAAWHYP